MAKRHFLWQDLAFSTSAWRFEAQYSHITDFPKFLLIRLIPMLQLVAGWMLLCQH